MPAATVLLDLDYLRSGRGRLLDNTEIADIIKSLDQDSWGKAEDAREKLVPLGSAVLPLFLQYYPKLQKFRGRTCLVYTAIKFARVSDLAVDLGIMALNDKSGQVRYRACMLLAFSLRQDAIPHLRMVLNHPDAKTVADAAAAIDAIEHQNHDFFQDRRHTGKTHWHVSGAPDNPT